MNVFFKDINLENIKYVGFDMDGTLYDEFDFIIQPYREISKLFLLQKEVLDYMLLRWINKGSSYNQIFDEAYDNYKLRNIENKEIFIKQALEIFRNYQPNLSLSARVLEILKYFKSRYSIFLVTDGNEKLQEAKFKALNLGVFFDKSDVVFTGKYAKEYAKPGIKSIELLNINPEEALFFGDRENDEDFSKYTGMRFKKVYNMLEVL